jgi:hypothetical protein
MRGDQMFLVTALPASSGIAVLKEDANLAIMWGCMDSKCEKSGQNDKIFTISGIFFLYIILVRLFRKPSTFCPFVQKPELLPGTLMVFSGIFFLYIISADFPEKKGIYVISTLRKIHGDLKNIVDAKTGHASSAGVPFSRRARSFQGLDRFEGDKK